MKRALHVAVAATSFFCMVASVQASELDETIKICASIAGITQNALLEMESKKIPLEKTQIFREVGHDPNLAKTLRDAVTVRRQGASIDRITDAWAQGCVNALGGQR